MIIFQCVGEWGTIYHVSAYIPIQHGGKAIIHGVPGDEHKNAIVDTATQFTYKCDVMQIPNFEGTKISVIKSIAIFFLPCLRFHIIIRFLK